MFSCKFLVFCIYFLPIVLFLNTFRRINPNQTVSRGDAVLFNSNFDTIFRAIMEWDICKEVLLLYNRLIFDVSTRYHFVVVSRQWHKHCDMWHRFAINTYTSNQSNVNLITNSSLSHQLVLLANDCNGFSYLDLEKYISMTPPCHKPRNNFCGFKGFI